MNESASGFSRPALETAYCFFHQKQRVYQYSTLEWQKDDIECAISSYVDGMDADLYSVLSGGQPDFLLDHSRFGADLLQAVLTLERMLSL